MIYFHTICCAINVQYNVYIFLQLYILGAVNSTVFLAMLNEYRLLGVSLVLFHSSPAGGAKTHAFVLQTALNLRGRSSVSPRSLLFCPDAGSIQTARNVVSVNREIQFLNQVSKSL